jgi:hypothetical protein
MTQNDLDLKTLRANLARAQERRDRAAVEYEAASREVAWLREGLRLFGAETEHDGDAMLRDVLPDGLPDQPTLRQAIILVMRASPRTSWTTAEIANHLAMNGWTPRQGDPLKRVSDMANVMINEGHLNRAGRGVYKLSELLAGALERALPRITDYRVAAGLGLSVPDHPASSQGLGDG